MIRPYRGGLVLPTLGKGLLSECPATSLNRKSTSRRHAHHPQAGAGHRPHGLKQSMRKVPEKKVASARKA